MAWIDTQSQSQNETCIAPLTKMDSGAEQNNILKHTMKNIYIYSLTGS